MRDFICLLPRVIRGMRRNKPAELIALGPRHGLALYLLLQSQRTVSELAAELELTVATTSNLVAELDREGFARRTEDPADRRRTIVTIVDERRPDVEGLLGGITAPIARVLERLTDEERAAFVKALQALDDELGVPLPAQCVDEPL